MTHEKLNLINEKEGKIVSDFDEVLCEDQNKFIDAKESNAKLLIIKHLDYGSTYYNYYIAQGYTNCHFIMRNKK